MPTKFRKGLSDASHSEYKSGSLKPPHEAESYTKPVREKQGASVSLSISRLNTYRTNHNGHLFFFSSNNDENESELKDKTEERLDKIEQAILHVHRPRSYDECIGSLSISTKIAFPLLVLYSHKELEFQQIKVHYTQFLRDLNYCDDFFMVTQC